MTPSAKRQPIAILHETHGLSVQRGNREGVAIEVGRTLPSLRVIAVAATTGRS